MKFTTRGTDVLLLESVFQGLSIEVDAPAAPVEAVDADAAVPPATLRKRDRDCWCHANVTALVERPQKSPRATGPRPPRHPAWAARPTRRPRPIDTPQRPRRTGIEARVIGA